MTGTIDAQSFALFDDNVTDNGQSILFEDPERVIVAHTAQEAQTAFVEIDRATADGLYVAGAFSYELAPLIDPAFVTQAPSASVPLIQLGLYRSRQVLDDQETDAFLERRSAADTAVVSDILLSETEPEYLQKIGRIKACIEAGDSYQVNHTIRARFRFEGCAIAYYRRLRESQKVSFGALLSFPDLTILSRSPELFFQKHGGRLTTRPMKGTAPRHTDVQADTDSARSLQTDEKSLAENLMIVDLLRNDLSRIAEPGTVAVDALFEVETYRTVHQMTSTISCRVSPEESLKYLFAGLFPCGSVTGAPKVRTMQIIRELETAPRGIYTGAIGYVTPQNDMRFSVPIRTVALQPDGQAELGIGSGIVHDSDALSEYSETLLKARFAFGPAAGFDLLESLYGDPDTGIRNLQAHLDRLESTASVFLFPCHRNDIESRLRETAAALPGPSKIRLTMNRSGAVTITTQLLGDDTPPRTVMLWDSPVNSRQMMYAYKTTDRAFYDRVWASAAKAHGTYDVLFVNQKGELTEASRHNVFLRFGDRYATPPLSCGVLPGVERAAFMAANRNRVDERILHSGDLEAADEILLTNSVRGVVSVQLLSAAPTQS